MVDEVFFVMVVMKYLKKRKYFSHLFNILMVKMTIQHSVNNSLAVKKLTANESSVKLKTNRTHMC